MDQGGGQSQAPWKPEELELRRAEIRHDRTTARMDIYSSVIQTVIAVVAVLATGVAFIAARKAGEAVDVAAEGIERQSAEDRLATAVAAMGGEQPAERAAGFRLLQHLTAREIADARGPTERDDARSLYGTSVAVLAIYLRNGPEGHVESDTAGPGYGDPEIPFENFYAAAAVRELMAMEDDVRDLAPGRMPAIDLSGVQLHGVPWKGIDFSWLGGWFFRGIDLRAANLRDSRWGEMREGQPRGATLTAAFLQCADLTGADLIGVDLSGTDLRGTTLIDVDLTGAILTGADLRAADLSGAVGLTPEQVAGARRDINTAGLDAATYGPPQGPLSTAPPTTDGTCFGDYQALPGDESAPT
jgi:hypothetical protein